MKRKKTIEVLNNSELTNQENSFFLFNTRHLHHCIQILSSMVNASISYSIKANSSEPVLKEIYSAKVHHFDVASLSEAIKVKKLFPECIAHFMHPVKDEVSIYRAYHELNIKYYAVDHINELEKLKKYAGKNIIPVVRIKTENHTCIFNLSEKFGANKKDAINLIQQAKKYYKKIGISFHIGSQSTSPDDYLSAIDLVEDIIQESAIDLHYLNLGGGLPLVYTNSNPPSIAQFLDCINKRLSKLKIKPKEIFIEPGRSLIAEAIQLVTKVCDRRGSHLYINNGIYNGLNDLGRVKIIPHCQSYRTCKKTEKLSKKHLPFSLYGPTCDNLDFIEGPMMLPENIQKDDFIVFSNAGAYIQSLSSNFNGFQPSEKLEYINDIIQHSNYPATDME